MVVFNETNIECICGYSNYRIWNTCPKCGKRLKDLMVPMSPDIELDQQVDLIEYERRKIKDNKDGKELSADGMVDFYYNTDTGKSSHELHEVMTEFGYQLITANKSHSHCGIFAKYDEKEKVLVLIKAKKHGKSTWKEEFRFFIDKEKRVYSPCYVIEYPSNTRKDLYPGYCFVAPRLKGIMKKRLKVDLVINETGSVFKEEICKLFPELKDNFVIPLAGNRMLNVCDPPSFAEFLSYSAKQKKKTGPKQQKIDELTQIGLREISYSEEKKLSDGVFEKFAVIEKVTDGICVLRTVFFSDNTFYEGFRLYVDGKNIYTCKKVNGEWLYHVLPTNQEDWRFSLVDYDKKVTEGTKLQYFSEIIENLPAEEKSLYIWAFLKYPYIEQIHKAGYGKLISNFFHLSRIHEKTLNTIIERTMLPARGKNFLQKMGFNSHQMRKINESFIAVRWGSYLLSIGGIIKMIACKKPQRFYQFFTSSELKEINFSISDLDDITFDRFFSFFENFYVQFGGKIDENGILDFEGAKGSAKGYTFINTTIMIVSCLAKVNELWGIKSALYAMEDLESVAKQENEDAKSLCPYRNEKIRMYDDYLHMVTLLNGTTCFSPRIRSAEHLTTMHDMASDMFMLKKDGIERANWDKNVKKAAKWEYTDPDTDFIAVAPVEPSELAREGTQLNHCVKSYISKAANGITNVMFIRKKSEPDKPFFTVEIDNSEFIQQVHGFDNCNANTAPEILPFIDHWCKAKKLKKMSINKVR